MPLLDSGTQRNTQGLHISCAIHCRFDVPLLRWRCFGKQWFWLWLGNPWNQFPKNFFWPTSLAWQMSIWVSQPIASVAFSKLQVQVASSAASFAENQQKKLLRNAQKRMEFSTVRPPHHPKKGLIHKSPANQFMNPTRAVDLFWIWPPALGTTDKSSIEGGEFTSLSTGEMWLGLLWG